MQKITAEVPENASSKQTLQLRLKSCLGEMVLLFTLIVHIFALLARKCYITAIPSENLGKTCFL